MHRKTAEAIKKKSKYCFIYGKMFALLWHENLSANKELIPPCN
jgi:hypothetical protein